MSKKKVYVGMSGGVDSSVVALLLARAGHDVTGVYLKCWDENAPGAKYCADPSEWRRERADALRVAVAIGIPLKTLDLTQAYQDKVVEYFFTGYEKGQTPNPDVECNRNIKFGAFLDWALEEGADYVATGHYAHVADTRNDKLQSPNSKVDHEPPTINYRLLAAADKTKDQTYFLWTLTQRQLGHCLFPIGDFTKREVRTIATEAKLPVAEKPDSQGLCFVGQINVRDYLQSRIPKAKGNIVDEEGKTIGEHEGVQFYTVGEHLGLAGESREIIARDAATNTLTVAPVGSAAHLVSTVTLRGVSWTSGEPPSTLDCQVRVRHRGELVPAQLQQEKGEWRIDWKKPQPPVASGQSCVIYDGDTVIGGGIAATNIRC